MAERQRLQFDFDELFPGKSVTIGDSSVIIRPLGIKSISSIITQLNAFVDELSKVGITFDNYQENTNLLKVATLLITKFPDILEEACNIHREDLERLPIEYIVSIIDTVVSVNIESRDTLVKNFASLTTKIKGLQKKQVVTKKKIQKKSRR
jgi:hypothetical protein